MLRHARAAVPWPLVITSSALVVALMGAVRAEPYTLWPLQGVAVGLVAAASGWCLDEPAAAVVDPSPRRLAWRTAARALGIGLVVGVWGLSVGWARDSLFGESFVVLLQGVAAAMLATAWVTWRRSNGEATPGNRWALSVLPIATVWALVRPFDEYVPVFPFAAGGQYGSWTYSAALWAAVGVAAMCGLALALDESRRFRPQRSARTPPGPVGRHIRDDQPRKARVTGRTAGVSATPEGLAAPPVPRAP